MDGEGSSNHNGHDIHGSLPHLHQHNLFYLPQYGHYPASDPLNPYRHEVPTSQTQHFNVIQHKDGLGITYDYTRQESAADDNAGQDTFIRQYAVPQSFNSYNSFLADCRTHQQAQAMDMSQASGGATSATPREIPVIISTYTNDHLPTISYKDRWVPQQHPINQENFTEQTDGGGEASPLQGTRGKEPAFEHGSPPTGDTDSAEEAFVPGMMRTVKWKEVSSDDRIRLGKAGLLPGKRQEFYNRRRDASRKGVDTKREKKARQAGLPSFKAFDGTIRFIDYTKKVGKTRTSNFFKRKGEGEEFEQYLLNQEVFGHVTGSKEEDGEEVVTIPVLPKRRFRIPQKVVELACRMMAEHDDLRPDERSHVLALAYQTSEGKMPPGVLPSSCDLIYRKSRPIREKILALRRGGRPQESSVPILEPAQPPQVSPFDLQLHL